MPDTDLWGLSGPSFLVIYLLAAAAATAYAVIAVGMLGRGRTPDPTELYADGPVSPEEIAYLHGGRPWVVDVAVARLLDAGGLRAARNGELSATELAPATDLDAAVLQAAGPGRRLRSIIGAVRDLSPVRGVEDGVVARGWALDPAVLGRRIVLGTVPLMVVGVVGLVRVAAGVGVHHAVEYLVMLLLATAVVVVGLLRRARWKLTPAGQEVRRQCNTAGTDHHEATVAWLHPALVGAVGAVALGGLVAYPDDEVRSMLATSGGGWDGGFGGGGGGFGGGGCGGGGGGGCGGGGGGGCGG